MDSFRKHHSPASRLLLPVRRVSRSAFASLFCFWLFFAVVPPAALGGGPYDPWKDTLTPAAESPFPALAPFRANYRFGWMGVGAGGASVEVAEARVPGRLRISASGGPEGLVRKLWNYQADYQGEAGSAGETPSWFRIDEQVARGGMVSEAVFGRDTVYAGHRFLTENKPWWFTPLPGVRDLFAAMLLVRSQPLRVGDRLRLTVYPDRNPYLVDLVVEGRDNLRILEKSVPALRFGIGIRTIETRGRGIGTLAPHSKFRSGRVWMSDDGRRLPLRAEVDVFIGSVFAELVKVTPPL